MRWLLGAPLIPLLLCAGMCLIPAVLAIVSRGPKPDDTTAPEAGAEPPELR